MYRFKEVTNEMLDIQARGFLMDMGIEVVGQICGMDRESKYLRYQCRALGFDVDVRVSSKPITLGHRIVCMELLHKGRCFQMIGLDTMNQAPPSNKHVENMEIGLARLVYNKSEVT